MFNVIGGVPRGSGSQSVKDLFIRVSEKSIFLDERVKHGWRIGLQSVSLGLAYRYLLYRVPTGTGMI